MSVLCYYSGVESPQHWQQCVNAGVRNLLMSFWQFYKNNPGLVAKRKANHPRARFLIDSGAHSFIDDWTKFRNWKKQDFEDYVKLYVNWIWKNRQHIRSVVEFDIDYTLNMVLTGSDKSTVGTAMVEDWQRRYFRPMEESGIQVIYVWHTERGMDGWEDMCAKFSYVGLPGELSADDHFNRYMQVARRYTTRVHGFAATKQLDFRDVDWYSIDSITWKTGEMYGSMIVWDHRAQKLEFVKKDDRPAYRDLLIERGFDADSIIRDTNYKEVTRFSLDSMRRMEAFYAQRYSDRTPYYETRLVHPVRLQALPDSSEYLEKSWKKFRPTEKFRHHDSITGADLKNVLLALAAVQYGSTVSLNSNPDGLKFLQQYFPAMVPLPSDIRVFQRELAIYTAPPNPPPKPRLSVEHFLPSNNPSRKRDDVAKVLSDALEPTPAQLYPRELLQAHFSS